MMAFRDVHWKEILPLLFLVMAVFVARVCLPYAEWLDGALSGFHAMDWRGILGVGAVVAFGVIGCAPASVLAVATGFVLGFGWGFPVMWGGALLGASGAFALSRFLLRERIRRRIEGRPRIQRVEMALSRGSWRLVALLRLTPVVPFFVLNYVSGATRMGVGAFQVGTGLAMLPGTAVYVSLGAGARSIAGTSKAWGWENWTLLGIGMVATMGAGIWARGIVREHMPELAER